MDLRNPALNPPFLPSPTKRSVHSRSPSRSPVRRHHSARDLDPILRDLSPTSTLRAFSYDDASSDHLSRSIRSTSHAERELGLKAAQSCYDLRSWARDIEGWQWPGTFDGPEPARKKQRTSMLSFSSMISRTPVEGEDDGEAEIGYSGSLPTSTVRAYQRRLHQISEDLDEIDVEELKDFVLSAHSQAGYGGADVDDSIGAIGADTNLKRLDDFTALVTATILQSLPYLSRLNRLLQLWTVRTSILLSAPTYMSDLAQARTDLDHGWAALAVSKQPTAATALQRGKATFSRETMLEMKAIVEKQVASLGSRLDGYLNMLEGREECVPDSWIDDFEQLEERYGRWVVQAERKVMEGEWRSMSPDAGAADTDRAVAAELPGSGSTHQSSSEIAVPAIIASTLIGAGAGVGAGMQTTTHSVSSGPQATTITNVLANGLNRQRPSDEDSSTKVIPPANSTNTSPSKPKHIPIVINGSGDGLSRTASGTPLLELPATNSREVSPSPSSSKSRAVSDGDASGQSVKKRAAFLNGDIEKSESLNKTKPAPIVRPFEHASNAFTRLFKRDKDDSRDGSSRSSSVGSQGKTGRLKEPKTSSLRSRSSLSRIGRPDLVSAASNESVPTVSSSPGRSRSQKPADRSADRVDLASVPPRTSSEHAKTRPRTPKGSEHVDMARVPPRTSSEYARRTSRPTTPKESVPSALEGVTRPTSSSSRSKHSSWQNITALPDLGGHTLPVVVPGATGPETYLPTGLNSAFHSPIEPESGLDFPDNWPLSSHITPTKDIGLQARQAQTDVAQEPLATDAFESVFISSFDPPAHRPVTSGINAANERETRFGGLTRPKTAPDSSSVFYHERPPPDWSLLRTGRSIENLRIEEKASSLPRPVSTVLEADEEGRYDNAAAYFGAAADSPPLASSSKGIKSSLRRGSSTPPFSPGLLKLHIPFTESTGPAGELIGRASAESIDAYPRSSVKSIEVRRSLTQDSPSLPHTPLETTGERGSTELFTPTSPLHFKDDVYFPSPPSVPPRASSLRSSLDTTRSDEQGRSVDQMIDSGDLSRAMAKNKRKVTAGQSSKVPAEDNFDRHVSEVLDRVHASNIKFKTRPGAETPQPQQRASAKLLKAGGPAKSMTLAPAEVSPKKSNPADPEVKLYHLTQAGRTEPIKLYVRLVGEGERVMVRVGGGWADLADYLRQYAEHHGSRTVSESGIQLQTIGSATTPTGPSNGFSKRTFSGPAASDFKTVSARGTPITPASAVAPLSRPSTKDSERSWLGLEQPRFTMGESDDSNTPSPTVTAQGSRRATLSGSRPSTAHGYSSLRLSDSGESSPMAGLGMAGPGSANKPKAELPEQKARWVEGMIERVNKSTTAEKSRFGDVSKVKRVMFRKGSTGAGAGAGG